MAVIGHADRLASSLQRIATSTLRERQQIQTDDPAASSRDGLPHPEACG
jgi:hypothetical protein